MALEALFQKHPLECEGMASRPLPPSPGMLSTSGVGQAHKCFSCSCSKNCSAKETTAAPAAAARTALAKLPAPDEESEASLLQQGLLACGKVGMKGKR